MIRRDGLWRDVNPGSYVRDKNEQTWRVDRWDGIVATITNRDGRTVKARPNPYDAVSILEMSMDDAVSVVQRIIGGTVIEDTQH